MSMSMPKAILDVARPLIFMQSRGTGKSIVNYGNCKSVVKNFKGVNQIECHCAQLTNLVSCQEADSKLI